jgi:outer membrane receptor protein involved in Fe transport
MSTDQPARGAEIARAGRQKFPIRAAFALLGAVATTRAGQAHAAPVYETVVVAPAAPAREPQLDHSASASVITTDRTPRSAEDLPQLISELPGVTVTRYGSYGSLATLSLRGSSPNQVAVYVDGVPLNSSVVGTVDLGLVPLTGISRIEVYRGSSPLAFGSSAMGGVVSLTSEGPDATGVAGHAGTGSFGTWMGGGKLAWVGRRLTVVTRASRFESDADFPYHNDNRTLSVSGDDEELRRQNNRLEQTDAALHATLALGNRRRLALAAAYLDRDQGLPARGSDRSYAAVLRRRRGYVSLSYDGNDDLGTGSRVHAVGYLLGADQRFSDPLREIYFRANTSHERSLTVGATALASRPLGDHFGLSTMLDARHEGYSPHADGVADRRPPGSRQFGAAGVAANFWLSPLGHESEITATVRAEVAHDSISPVDPLGNSSGVAQPTTEVLPVARLGLVTHVTGRLRLRANGGSYARLPTLSERYGNGGTLRGNPLLVPERGETADLGTTYFRQGVNGDWDLALDAAVFAARSRQLIELLDLGYYAGYANVARSRSWGGELAAAARVLRYVQLRVQATYIRATDRSIASDDPHQLPHQPTLRAYLRPELRGVPLGRSLELGAYGDLDLTSSRFADPANLIRQPGRRIYGAGASLACAPLGLRVIFSAYNLGSETASDALEFPLPGRSFFLTLEFAYSKQESTL